MNSHEHDIQAAFVEWVSMSEARHPALKLGFAVPNGSFRHKAVAGRLKAEGVRAGVWDWLLPVGAGQYSGMAIEFKAPGGRLSKTQWEFGAMLAAAGWLCAVCRDPEHAVRLTTEYLALGVRLTLPPPELIVREVNAA